MDGSDKFKDYLDKIKDVKEDRCWFCKKTPDAIRSEFFEYMKHPDAGYEDISLDDIIIMTYKLNKPVCAGCYFNFKQNPDLIKEILESKEEDIW